jgi:hypothetical protein
MLKHSNAICFRFEGSIFFAYDRHFLQKEEDRLEDAIIYFYPHSVRFIASLFYSEVSERTMNPVVHMQYCML